MYYFINNTVTKQQSGIGHAEIKRFQLFNKYKQPVKILTFDFSRSLTDALKFHGIDDYSAVNLYDFFGGTEHVPTQKFGVADLHLPAKFKVEKIDKHYDVTQDARLIMRIVMRNDKPDWIESVTYFDSAKRIIQGDFWDCRGYRNLQQFYDRKGNVRVRRILNNHGRAFFESFDFHKDYDGDHQTLYRLIGYQGHDWQFSGAKNLIQFFFDELVKRDRQNGENDVFVSDASLADAWSLLHMRQPAFKIMHLHNNHSNNQFDVMHGGLNFNYEYSLNNFARWQWIIAPSPSQAHDVAARFGDHPKTYPIPVGVVPDELMQQPKQDFSKREPGRIVMIARLSHEKRIDHAIKAVAKAIKKVPNITLHIYGYANDDSGDKAKKLVNDLHLKKAVTFEGYTDDMDGVYNNAQMSVLTSTTEGLPLSLIEAQSHGLPIASYDVNYGPRDIVNDGKDGFLIKSGDIDGMADAIIKIMSDDKLRKQFSDTAYQSRYKYSEDNVWKHWQNFDQDAKQFFKRLGEVVS